MTKQKDSFYYPILNLVLKGCWYDKIASGEKTSEYRECKPYWDKRFNNPKIKVWVAVIFHRGYTNKTMTFLIDSIGKTTAKNDLNLPEVWEIKLGPRVKKELALCQIVQYAGKEWNSCR